MPLDYEQYLTKELEALYFDTVRYSELRRRIQSDKDIIFAVRKDQIHIYYLGGRILKLTKFYNKSTKSYELRFAFDQKYTKKEKGSDERNKYGNIIKNLSDNPCNDELWIKYFNDLKLCMKEYRNTVSHNPERQLQQNLELNNRDFNDDVIVVDNEYGVRHEHKKDSKLCKVDLVTLYRDNGEYKICLVELKLGDGAIDGKAGIADHIADFELFLNERKADIIASINNLIQYKKKNNSLYNAPNDIKITEDTDICVSILCYDLPENKKAKALSFIDNARADITFDLHCNLELKCGNFQLTKKDILGE